MVYNSLGELVSLGAVLGWTISALAFESAGRLIGSLPLNLIRLVMACILLVFIGIARSLTPWPMGIGRIDIMWLLISGFVGFFLGDLLLFRSYLIIGSRLAMLVMSLTSPISALLDRLVFGTRLVIQDILGMALTMLGVALALTTRRSKEANNVKPVEKLMPRMPIRHWVGFLLAFGAAVGQSGGMILGKLGLASHDAFGATFIRTLGGLAGFIPLIILSAASGRVWKGLQHGRAMLRALIGALAGPVLGVSAVLFAMRHSPAGVVSAITAIVPITIILPSVIFLKERIYAREVWGAIIAVSGVALLFLT